jgi:fatty-acyl-CoA synthase
VEGGAGVIDEFFAYNATRFASRPALRTRSVELSYGQLWASSSTLAAELSKRGVAHRSRVAIAAGNSPEFVVAHLAVLRLGGVVVPLNTRLAAAEMQVVLGDVAPDLVVATDAWRDLVISGGARAAETLALGLDGDAVLTADGAELAPGGDVPQVDPRTRLRTDPALILYTSGTTGRPKGAVLSHEAVIVNSISVLGRLGMHDPTEWRHVGVPLFHSGGINSIMQQFLLGGPIFLSETGGFDAEAVLDDFEQNHISTAFFAPTQWQQICAAESIARRTLSLKRIVWGTSSTPLEILRKLNETFEGLPVYAQFGQTEICGTACTLDPEFAESKIGSVGRPLSHIQLRIVDNRMRDVGPGQTGEIVYRGPTVMTEYWNAPDATEAAFSDGWFHSGDLARVDDDGFYHVVGRIKEMIVSGGENIYPLEIENALQGHPKVREVAVVGVPHPRWMETPLAVVVPTDPASPPSLAELHEYLTGRLASYKKPTILEIRDSLPRNPTGKLVKHTLKANHVHR